MSNTIGIPYARENDDGSKTCPVCGEKCFGIDLKQNNLEDKTTKGSGQCVRYFRSLYNGNSAQRLYRNLEVSERR